MTSADPPPITRVLSRISRGEPGAAEELLPLVYAELKTMARAKMANLRAGHTLQATALVHEAWIKLGGNEPAAFVDRAHFFGAAARAMRNILVDQARAKAARKRGGGAAEQELTPDVGMAEGLATIDVVALDEALTKLERDHGRVAQVVMLRYFAGLEFDEIASALAVTSRTVERDWRFAKAWLRRELGTE